MTLAELRKQIHEKKILLDAIDARDEEEYDNVVSIEDKDKREIELLKARITEVQKDIYKYPVSNSSPSDNKKQLQRKLTELKNKIPSLVQNVKSIENEIVQFKLQLFKAKAEHEHPGSTITGTGPNGTITDSDRRKAKNRALLKARMASLTGKASSGTVYDFEAFENSFNAELDRLTREKETIETTMRDIEESSAQISREVEASLRGGSYSEETNPDREYNRFEEAIGVEDDVKDLIYSLQRFKPAAPVVAEAPEIDSVFTFAKKSDFASGSSSSLSSSRQISTSEVPSAASSTTASRTASPQPVQRTPAERAAYIKAEAKRRMEERMAAMGIKRPGTSSSPAKSSPAASTHSTPESTSESKFASPSLSTVPVPKPAASLSSAPVPKPATSLAHASATQPQAEANHEISVDESSSSDDDDDYDDEQFKRMLQQRASRESPVRDTPAADTTSPDSKPVVNQAKESQMEKLKAQMEAMKREQLALEAENDSDSDTSDGALDEQINKPEQQTQSYNPFLSAGNNNPFAKMAAQKQQVDEKGE